MTPTNKNIAQIREALKFASRNLERPGGSMHYKTDQALTALDQLEELLKAYRDEVNYQRDCFELSQGNNFIYEPMAAYAKSRQRRIELENNMEEK